MTTSEAKWNELHLVYNCDVVVISTSSHSLFPFIQVTAAFDFSVDLGTGRIHSGY